MQLNPEIFRAYDIRGVVDKDLSEEAYYHLGRGYGTFLSQRRITVCTVGRDNRINSENYSKSFIKGLNDSGIYTIDLGLSMSQIVYFSSYTFLTKGSAMITASHNPKEYNGVKLGVGYSDTMLTTEIQSLKEIIDTEKYVSGKGRNAEVNIFPDYKQYLLKTFSLKKRWKIVIDACNTGSGFFYPEIFKGLGCEVICQNCDLDGRYPLGAPDPTELKVLERLAKRVIEENADIGFGYDADGDRMAVVDNKGSVLWMDTIVALFAIDVLEYIPGAPIVFNNLCSKVVEKTIKKHGGVPVMWKTGHSYIKAKIKEVRSPFGGELSGHIFFMDNFFGHDDAAYASLRLLSFLERKNQSLSDTVATLDQYISSPEIKLGLADNIKNTIVEKQIKNDLEVAFPGSDVSLIDGVRVDMENQMAVVRASQNGPYITIKFEAETQEKYTSIKKKLKEILLKYPEIDWKSGVNTSSLD